MRYPDYLVHFNKNHDIKTGRFTFSNGVSLSNNTKNNTKSNTKNKKKKQTSDLNNHIRTTQEMQRLFKQDMDTFNQQMLLTRNIELGNQFTQQMYNQHLFM